MSSGSANKSIVQTASENIVNQQNRWNRSIFDNALFDHGYKAYIERAIQCPCSVKGISTPLSDCGNCGGTGWVFIDKIDTVVQCTSMANRNKYEPWTAENMGTVSVSVRAQDKLGYMDKIVLTELESWFSQVVKPIKNVANNAIFSFLTYEPVTVYDVFLFEGSNQPLRKLHLTTDYTIQDNKILLNYTEFNSIQNISLSVRYTHKPTYLVIDINRDLIKQKQLQECSKQSDEKTNFPLNCIARKAHYVMEAPNFNGTSLFDNTDYEELPKKYDY